MMVRKPTYQKWRLDFREFDILVVSQGSLSWFTIILAKLGSISSPENLKQPGDPFFIKPMVDLDSWGKAYTSPQDPCLVNTTYNHKNHPSVGKYTIHWSYVLWSISPGYTPAKSTCFTWKVASLEGKILHFWSSTCEFFQGICLPFLMVV